MVVASSNNAAVANVSNEIPNVEAIAAEYVGLIDYFTDVATALLRPDQPGGDHSDADEEETDSGAQTLVGAVDQALGSRGAWALTAARLGKKAYRNQFHTRFWFGSSTIGFNYVAVQKQLQQWAKGPPPTSWEQAVEAFHTALSIEREAIRRRQSVATALQRLAEIADRTRRLVGERGRAHADLRSSIGQKEALRSRLLDAHEVLAQSVDRRRRNREFRPAVLQSIMTLGRAMRRWDQTERPLAAAMEEAERHTSSVQADLNDQHKAEKSAAASLARVDRDLADARVETAGLSRLVDEAARRWGRAVPDPSWWTDVVRRESTGPWLDRELNQARIALLLAALTLHREFLHHTAATIESSLRAAVEVVAGTAPSELPREAVRASWQTIFLVVPLVSTTFASFGRMFRGLERADLGWLLIDEAGQAAAQHGVGALWRSARTVVVGDPQQLKPVITIPPRLQGAIAKFYDVTNKWLPHGTSMQRLADEVNTWGTWLEPTAHSPRLWIGAPLRVHRRCDQPMLDICNKIAYPVAGSEDPRTTGLMINGVGRRGTVRHLQVAHRWSPWRTVGVRTDREADGRQASHRSPGRIG